MTVHPLQIFTNGPTVEVRITVNDETSLSVLTPREAYTLATFTEWLYDEGRETPSTLPNLPDHLAVDMGEEDCQSCLTPHKRPVVYVAASVGGRLNDVRTVELRNPADLNALPYYLNAAAVAANTFEEPTHV